MPRLNATGGYCRPLWSLARRGALCALLLAGLAGCGSTAGLFSTAIRRLSTESVAGPDPVYISAIARNVRAAGIMFGPKSGRRHPCRRRCAGRTVPGRYGRHRSMEDGTLQLAANCRARSFDFAELQRHSSRIATAEGNGSSGQEMPWYVWELQKVKNI